MSFENQENPSKRGACLYIIGDRVLIKRDLTHNKKYGGAYYATSMEFAVEEPLEIKDICIEDGYYFLEHGLVATPFMIDHKRSKELNK